MTIIFEDKSVSGIPAGCFMLASQLVIHAVHALGTPVGRRSRWRKLEKSRRSSPPQQGSVPGSPGFAW